MHIFREYASYPREHRITPRVAAEQPIAMAGRELMITSLTCHALVQMTLRHQGGHEIVGAPDERHADPVRIAFGSRDALLDSFPVIGRQCLLKLRIDQAVEPKMSD